MKIAITIFALSLITFTGISQNNETAEPENSNTPTVIHKLGLHSGTTSGVGLSYKALIKNTLMIQAVTLPVASQDYKYINSGLSIKYKFRDYNLWDFYAYGAGNYIYTQSSYGYYSLDETEEFIYEYNSNFHTSVGIAAEFGKGEFLKWSMQMGYALYNIGSDYWQTNLSIGTTLDFSLNSK